MKPRTRRYLIAFLAVAGGFVLVLWSWNTLATLFGLPEAEARHALAALVLLGALRLGLAGRRHGVWRHEHTPR